MILKSGSLSITIRGATEIPGNRRDLILEGSSFDHREIDEQDDRPIVLRIIRDEIRNGVNSFHIDARRLVADHGFTNFLDGVAAHLRGLGCDVSLLPPHLLGESQKLAVKPASTSWRILRHLPKWERGIIKVASLASVAIFCGMYVRSDFTRVPEPHPKAKSEEPVEQRIEQCAAVVGDFRGIDSSHAEYSEALRTLTIYISVTRGLASLPTIDVIRDLGAHFVPEAGQIDVEVEGGNLLRSDQ